MGKLLLVNLVCFFMGNIVVVKLKFFGSKIFNFYLGILLLVKILSSFLMVLFFLRCFLYGGL